MRNDILIRLVRLLPDKIYLSLKYYKAFGRWPNWKNPQTFSEKLQWLKLYDRKPVYTTLVDKFAVKRYVADTIGEEYVIPTLGVWDKPEDIEWDKLPNRFVLKTTHGGGNEGVVICRNKSTFDRDKAIRLLNESLKTDLYIVWREWPYKNVPKRVIAEEYIEPRPDIKDLANYKFFCFDGKVKGLFVATERQNPNEEVKFDFFDAEFNHLPFRQGHDHARITPKKPENFELMKKTAEQLSKGMHHVRVDLYDLGGKVLFGELTLFHFSGMVPFEPEEWDKRFGDMLTLPGKKLEGVIIRQLQDNSLQLSNPDLTDYKWYCFNGVPIYCQVIQDRSTKETIDFFDKDWKHQDFVGLTPFMVNAQRIPSKPSNLDKQINVASKLSKGIPFCRIDLYNVEERIIFGEITFYPNSGVGCFSPSEWDIKIGNLLILP